MKFVGHHYAADGPWLKTVLGMEVYGKCVLDTEFAQQCVDESSELKLERGIAMRYTTLGRYNIDLVMWKRANKKQCEDGYGYVPESILVPYASSATTPAPARARGLLWILVPGHGASFAPRPMWRSDPRHQPIPNRDAH